MDYWDSTSKIVCNTLYDNISTGTQRFCNYETLGGRGGPQTLARKVGSLFGHVISCSGAKVWFGPVFSKNLWTLNGTMVQVQSFCWTPDWTILNGFKVVRFGFRISSNLWTSYYICKISRKNDNKKFHYSKVIGEQAQKATSSASLAAEIWPSW